MTSTKMESEDEKILKEIVKGCYQCGVCTGCCPLGYFIPYRPSLYISDLLLGNRQKVLQEGHLWTCLTCGYCYERCPQNINFPEMVKDARIEMRQALSLQGEEAHDGIFSLSQKMMADESLQRSLPDYVIPEGITVAETGETAYFIGCLPFFDVYFKEDYGFNGLSIVHDTFKILDALLDDPPVILRKEKCCGHDALWRGDIDIFKSLAKQNIEVIKDSGAKKVILSCAEGYMTLKKEYTKYFDFGKVEILHITEFIAQKMDEGAVEFVWPFSPEISVTYHDPCRLGRFMKVYDAPRRILNSIEGVHFYEMERHKETALCCGVPGFLGCNDVTKGIRTDRITEATSTAQILVTTCPKCQIHFNCLLNEKRVNGKGKLFQLEIYDIVNLVAKAMGLREPLTESHIKTKVVL